MVEATGNVPRTVTSLSKGAGEVEEDAQAFALITAQSPVHVPFTSSCHWGLQCMSVRGRLNLARIFRVCNSSPAHPKLSGDRVRGYSRRRSSTCIRVAGPSHLTPFPRSSELHTHAF